MTVSVVVPTYRRPDMLSRCLLALLRQDLDPTAYEIVIADDGADEGTRSAVLLAASEALCAVRYVPVTGNHGPAAARNAGWRAAAGEIIAFTDDDCVPETAWLREGISFFALDERVTAVRGRLEMPLPSVPTDYELNASGLAAAEFVTANCFCRRTALESIGGFDEMFTRAWREDSDLYFRLLDHGGRILRQSRAVVVHPIRPAGWGVSVRQQRNNLFDALLYRKHPSRYRVLLGERTPWRYYAILASAVLAVYGIATGRKRVAAAGAALWAAQTARFTRVRLAGTSRSSRHVAEMAVTSMVIPPVALYWRWRGAVRFRVPFL